MTMHRYFGYLKRRSGGRPATECVCLQRDDEREDSHTMDSRMVSLEGLKDG
jgi:hypothetical protein